MERKEKLQKQHKGEREIRDEEREEKIGRGKKRMKRSTAVKICCCGLRLMTVIATGTITSIKYDKQMTKL